MRWREPTHSPHTLQTQNSSGAGLHPAEGRPPAALRGPTLDNQTGRGRMASMKTMLLITSFLLAIAAPVHAVDIFLKVNFSGTAQSQTILGASDGRIHTSLFNNKRVFQEFNVSKADYELVLELGVTDQIALVPKHASAMLPTITVLTFTGGVNGEVINTKTRLVRLETGIASPASGNLFENLGGQLIGTLHYSGSVPGSNFTNFNFTAIGAGKDQSNPGSMVLLQFKVTDDGHFTQAP
jgi:hypothetical protein